MIFGLGIILFFAYNWAAIPKLVKLAVMLGSLIVTHGIAIKLGAGKPERSNLALGFHLLGTMLFDAGMELHSYQYFL